MQYLEELKNIIEREILEEENIINIEEDFKIKPFFGGSPFKSILEYNDSNLIYYESKNKDILVISLIEKPYNNIKNYLGLSFKTETGLFKNEFKYLFLDYEKYVNIYLVKYTQKTLRLLSHTNYNKFDIKAFFEIIDISSTTEKIKILKNNNNEMEIKLYDRLSDFYLFDKIIQDFFHYTYEDLSTYQHNKTNLLFETSEKNIYINYILDKKRKVTYINNLDGILFKSKYYDKEYINPLNNNHSIIENSSHLFNIELGDELEIDTNTIYILNSNEKEFWIDRIEKNYERGLKTEYNYINLKKDFNILFHKLVSKYKFNKYTINIFNIYSEYELFDKHFYIDNEKLYIKEEKPYKEIKNRKFYCYNMFLFKVKNNISQDFVLSEIDYIYFFIFLKLLSLRIIDLNKEYLLKELLEKANINNLLIDNIDFLKGALR